MTSSEPAAGKVNLKLYCMTGAMIHFDQSVFTHMRGFGRRVKVQTPIFLIDHPSGKVLFETGLYPGLAIDRYKDLTPSLHDWEPEMTPDQAADKQLEKLGIHAKDIRYVILSCLIPDHAGGMCLFPNATFIVQFRELQEAWWPDQRVAQGQAYQYGQLLATRDFKYWQLHDEDLDLFGDGTIRILFSPAHTRGEQALVLRLPNTGTVVMPAGVCPQKANFVEGIMTGTPAVDPAIVQASMARLRRIAAQENALVIHHHDPDDWKSVRKAPEFYD
jgi:N-acyl homoserine lactone hydrolase